MEVRYLESENINGIHEKIGGPAMSVYISYSNINVGTLKWNPQCRRFGKPESYME
jgi:hypothetical protein